MTLAPELMEHVLIRALQAFHPQAVDRANLFRDELTAEIPSHLIRLVCEFLKNHPELCFEFLADLTALDRFPLEPRFEVVYHLLSLKTNARLRLKVRLAAANPRVDSVIAIWPGANWFEREVFDLFGIHFNGHPDLRRILMPDEWEGHPLRKDYPVEGYR